MTRNEEMVLRRREGKTLQEIGDEFGITRERVRQIVGPCEPKADNCVHCGKALPEGRDPTRLYCSAGCSRRSSYRRSIRTCEHCGEPSQGVLCKSCRRDRYAAEREAQYQRLEAMWGEGLSMAEIAESLGTSENSLGVLICRARRNGRKLPYRRVPKRVGGLSKKEARTQLTSALRNGELRRPSRCEDCGELAPVDGHHTDYQRPLYVVWLCEICHQRAHGKVPVLREAA